MSTTNDDLILIQVRVDKKLHQALVDRMIATGDIAMAAFLRRVLTDYVRKSDEKKASHGKK